jgi:hypothetical protein
MSEQEKLLSRVAILEQLISVLILVLNDNLSIPEAINIAGRMTSVSSENFGGFSRKNSIWTLSFEEEEPPQND